jgi:hypothetical protein
MTLVCPSCAAEHGDEERFCRDCGLPLVPPGGPAEAVLDERGERMRKVKKQYAEGDLVRVAVARQQPEAEFVQSLLLEEGIPSTLRRSIGFDVPEMLAAGPRDVLVPKSGEDAAREVLRQAEVERVPVRARQPRIVRLVAGGLVAFIVGGFVFLVVLVILL